MACDLFFNDDSNISTIIFQSKPLVEHTLGDKRTVMQNNCTFYETNVFSLIGWFYIFFKINTFLDLKWNKRQQKLRATWYNRKLGGYICMCNCGTPFL